MQKVYYTTNPGNDAYRWFTRKPSDKYIMIHKNDISGSRLDSHSFYPKMEFKEVLVESTIRWVNHVLDTGVYISQSDFEEHISVVDKSKPSFKNGDIVIAETCSEKWIMKLGSFTNGRWGLVKGFPYKNIGKKPTYFDNAYANIEEIDRHATVKEVEHFDGCYRNEVILLFSGEDSKILVSWDEVAETDWSPDTNDKIDGIINFGIKNKKEQKVKSSKVKFQISKINKYEY